MFAKGLKECNNEEKNMSEQHVNVNFIFILSK